MKYVQEPFCIISKGLLDSGDEEAILLDHYQIDRNIFDPFFFDPIFNPPTLLTLSTPSTNLELIPRKRSKDGKIKGEKKYQILLCLCQKMSIKTHLLII